MLYSVAIIRQMLAEAFDAGSTSPCELKDDCVNDIMVKYENAAADSSKSDMRIYQIAELHKMPDGTRFEHLTLGKCIIRSKNQTKFMEFENHALAPGGFNVEDYPWNQPMRRI